MILTACQTTKVTIKDLFHIFRAFTESHFEFYFERCDLWSLEIVIHNYAMCWVADCWGIMSENVCYLRIFDQVFLFSHLVVAHKIILEKYAMFLDYMNYNFSSPTSFASVLVEETKGHLGPRAARCGAKSYLDFWVHLWKRRGIQLEPFLLM